MEFKLSISGEMVDNIKPAQNRKHDKKNTKA